MPDDLIVSPELTVPGDELAESFSTSTGPGGQHANRSSTRVELRWHVGSSRVSSSARDRILSRLDGDTVTVTASDSRSQFRNRQLARRRLRERLEELLQPEPPPRRPTKPSRGARQRRLDEKSRRSQVKRQRRKPELE